MKRLGLFAYVLLFAISLLSVFPTSHVFAIEADEYGAVTQPNSPAPTKAKSLAEYKEQGNALFATQLKLLEAKKTDLTSGQYPPGTKEVVDQVIQVVTKASSAFSTKMNSGGASPSELYSQSLQSGINAIGEAQRAAGPSIRNPYANNTFSGFINQLRNEASKEAEAARLAKIGYSEEAIKRAQEITSADNAKAVGTTSQGGEPVVEECGVIGSGSIIACISEGFTWIIKNIFLNIAGFFLWLTANLFNYAVKIGVLEFAKWAPEQLYATWIIIRQIVSLLIVFIGLYLGFMYILGKDEKFQRYIPWVIMFALFVNFSYPITRTAIDLSNIVSLNIYSSVVGTNVLDGSDGSYKNSGGDLIVDKLGLQGLVASATTKEQSGGMLGAINSVPAALLAVCYVLFAAYIFFMVTALFVLRTVALVFLTVASPLLLVDSVFPMLGEKAKLLRKIFFEQLAIGPIFMIMFALTVKFLDVFKVLGKTDSFSSQASAVGSSTITTFFNILMMLIMLWIMLKVTKSAAGSLGEYATNAMGTVGGFAVGAATGGIAAGSGLLARKGIGALAAKARDSKWITNNQDSFIGRRAYNLSNAVANSTFDIRNSAVAQKVSSKMGFSMGMGTKMGYDEEWAKKKKDVIDRSARIKTHYERDVYKEDKFGKKVLDEKGQAILLHRRGDVDEEGMAAKRRFAMNSGGARFLTKKEREELDDSLLEDLTSENQKVRTETDKESSEDFNKYNSLTSKSDKVNFVSNLRARLTELQTTDKNGTGKQSQSILKTLKDIERKDSEEKIAFDKQVQNVLSTYTKKKGEDKEIYFTNQSQEIQNAVSEILADEQRAARNATNNALDLDLTQPSQAKRQSGIDAARNLAPQVQAILADKPLHGAVPINSPGVDIPLEGDSSSSSSKPFDVSQVSTVDFAANRRAEKLKIATEAARAEMDRNSNKVVHPVPGEPIPSAQTQAPTTPAANQPTKDAAVA